MRSPAHTVVLTRIINASPEQLYAAWTQPEIMRRWMAQKVEADVQVGGHYRNEIDAGEIGTFVHTGEYLVLEPNRRVKQTFKAGNVDLDHYSNEYIEVTFRPQNELQTEIIFVNGWDGQGIDEDSEEGQALRQAWSGWLDALEKLF